MLKLNAVRLGLGKPLQLPPSLSSFSISASPASASALRFASGGSGEEMDDSKKHDPKSKTVDTDTMASSFGEGYATRSDDDGFGGVYGRNDEADEDTNVHEVDHSQGSEVKEKEKSRNQEKLANV